MDNLIRKLRTILNEKIIKNVRNLFKLKKERKQCI